MIFIKFHVFEGLCHFRRFDRYQSPGVFVEYVKGSKTKFVVG